MIERLRLQGIHQIRRTRGGRFEGDCMLALVGGGGFEEDRQEVRNQFDESSNRVP